MNAVKDYKKEFEECIHIIRVDLNKLSFDIQNFKVLLNSFYPFIKNDVIIK